MRAIRIPFMFPATAEAITPARQPGASQALCGAFNYSIRRCNRKVRKGFRKVHKGLYCGKQSIFARYLCGTLRRT